MNGNSDLSDAVIQSPPDPRTIPRPVAIVADVAGGGETRRRGRKLIPQALTESISKPKAKPTDNEQQRQAFEFYFELGNNRSLAKVAERFGVKPDIVGKWAQRKQWTKRIRELEQRNVCKVIEDTALQVILNKFKAMFIIDPVDGKSIILDPTASVGAVRDLVSAYVALDKNNRDREQDLGASGKGKNQVMVNVIIEK